MKTRNKVLLTLMCAVALVAGSVFGTYAYLTSKDTVTNTFTVGNVYIELNETDTDEDNDTKNNKYHLLPGETYVKDPTVTVIANSEDAYVRMLVKVSDIKKLKAAIPATDYDDYYQDDVFLLQKLCLDENGADTWNQNWEVYGVTNNNDGTATYEFRYKDIVHKSAADTPMEALFTKITVPNFLTNEQLANWNEIEIEISAHAIQATGFDNADAAWAVFNADKASTYIPNP